MFNFVEFLIEQKIPYVTSGPNVSSGNVNIKCPMCGPADPSQHLGIHIASGVWGCWRIKDHRGRRPHRLIMALLNCSYMEADHYFRSEQAFIPDDFLEEIETLLEPGDDIDDGEKSISKDRVELRFLNGFRRLRHERLARRFIWYLCDGRGFKPKDIELLGKQYGLRYVLSGVWKNRIIIPVFMGDQLVNWTGRTISDLEKIRYMSVSHEKTANPRAPMSIKNCLYRQLELIEERGDILAITEGPFDAIHMDYFLSEHGIRATCIFGTAFSEEQIWIIHELSDFFKRVCIVLDRGAMETAMILQTSLAPLETEIIMLPSGIEDPGEITFQNKNSVLSLFD